MSRPFTVERLTALLQRPDTFWRHDVDLSLEAAVKMAELEYSLGVRATYYLMIASPAYVPTDMFLASLTIAALGHRIGLHVDERHWTPNADLAPGLAVEAPVSFHCPTEAVLWKRFPGIENAYDPVWEEAYYADSGGSFRFGDPEDAPDGGVIQVNLHPEWWFDPEAALRLPFHVHSYFFGQPHPDDPGEDGPGDAPAGGSWATS